MNVPADLQYTKEHEWVRRDGDVVTVGITDFAQDSLGDVVFVELPTVGTVIAQGATFGVVESNKSVSDLFAPMGGEVVAVNPLLAERPELVNESPYGEGWMIRLRPTAPADATSLLGAEAYSAHIASEQHG